MACRFDPGYLHQYQFRSINMSNNKELKVTFAPGCFDSFDGTQQDLDDMMEEITEMFADGIPEGVEVVALDETSLSEEEWALLDAADAARVARGTYLQ